MWPFSFIFRCIVDGKYQQAIGMAIECRRLDKLEEAITRSDNAHATINYCIDISHSFVNRREYRREVKSYSKHPKPFCVGLFRYPINCPVGFYVHSFAFYFVRNSFSNICCRLYIVPSCLQKHVAGYIKNPVAGIPKSLLLQ